MSIDEYAVQKGNIGHVHTHVLECKVPAFGKHVHAPRRTRTCIQAVANMCDLEHFLSNVTCAYLSTSFHLCTLEHFLSNVTCAYLSTSFHLCILEHFLSKAQRWQTCVHRPGCTHLCKVRRSKSMHWGSLYARACIHSCD